jgi:beta-phosphoglucomutase-like phosphatase (HAD superfamily)
MAAGIILAREAGAAVTDADGTPHTITSTATIAAPEPLIPHLIPLIQSARVSEVLGTEPPPDVTASADLDRILSRARYLIFDFDGPIRDPGTGTPAGYIHEALAACRDSGRTPVTIAVTDPAEIDAYLTRNDLDELIRHVYTLNSDSPGQTWVGGQLLRDTISALGASPSDCALITATPATIHDAQDIGLPAIGYALTLEADQRLTAAGTEVLLPSLADLTLRLRARPLPN